MKVYYVHQVVDWNGKPLDHEVSFRVESKSKQAALRKVARDCKMPVTMFTAVLQRESKS